jgi:hypothetical protein
MLPTQHGTPCTVLAAVFSITPLTVRIQQRFAALCFNRFFPRAHYGYSLTLEELKLQILRMRRHRLDALFLTQVYFGLKFCSSGWEIVGLRVPAR